MDPVAMIATRRALHGVAELVLAGPQYARGNGIRLRVTPGGFGTVAAPEVRVEGETLVTGAERLSMSGRSYADLASSAGLEARALDDVYSGGPGIARTDVIQLDPGAADQLERCLAQGDAALRELAPGEMPVLWPEHFDVGITLDEVNYGVSLGDEHIAEPYAYVGPWHAREGAFWNAPFGAARPLAELGDVTGIAAFFAEGRALTCS